MQTYRGSCHCGAVAFEIDAEIETATRCNCSICRKKNALMHRVPADRFRLLQGEDALSLYQWNTGTARHLFCKTCGVYPFHNPRAAPDEFTVNLACLEGLDVDALPVRVFDGKDFSLEGSD